MPSSAPSQTSVESASGFASWPLAVSILLVTNLVIYCVNRNSWPARFLAKLFGNSCLKGCNGGTFHATRTVIGQRTLPYPQQFWAFDVICPSDVVCSALVPVPVLLVWRLGVLAHFGATILVDALDDGINSNFMVFFTHWTLVAMGVQGLVSTTVTAIHVRRKQSEITWNFGLKLMLVLEQTVPTSALFLTLFYWAALYDPETEDVSGSNLMKHGINVVVMLCSFFLSNIPFISYHIQFTVLFLTAYCVFMWIYAEATGVWSYSVMDYSESTSLLYYVLVPILLVICFYIWFLLGMLRDVVSYKCCKRDAFVRMPFHESAVAGAITSSSAAHTGPQDDKTTTDEEAQ